MGFEVRTLAEGKRIVAKAMLEKEMEVEMIASLTGMSIEEVQSLK